jgi:hypothetical protein
MLLWRCVGFVADVVCPDLLGGLKRADEYGAAIDPGGDVITVVPEPPATSAPPPEPTLTPTEPSLEDLVEKYTAEAVMQAAGGRIPGTTDEVRNVAAILDHAAEVTSNAGS